MFLPRITANRCPAFLSAGDPAAGVFGVIGDGSRGSEVFWLWQQSMGVDNSEMTLVRLYDGADIDTASAAQKKISRLQAESISI